MTRILVTSLATLLLAGTAHAQSFDQPSVIRTAADRVTVSWGQHSPVDVFDSDDANALPGKSRPVSMRDVDGTEAVQVAPGKRVYFLLRDRSSGKITHAAERVLPLQQGSNFRDVGGYPAAGGKHVRWGHIFRSGGQPMLTETDLATIRSLGLVRVIDLRSSEERVLAPSRIEGVPYQAIGYSMASLMGTGAPKNGEGIYRALPGLLAPHLRLVFDDLVANEGPIAYNCSAGQDRTGFVTAMVLSALGVPRETILADYHLSTKYRVPEWELPKIDTALYAANPVAMMFARYQKDPAAARPQPLMDPDGTAFLTYAFDAIEKRYGSVDAYLEQEAGVTKQDLATLRATYLE